MAVTVQRFLKAFPDFKETSAELIEQKINLATLRTAASVWGTKYDDGIMMLTAHLLSISPNGEQARLKAENRHTVYGIEHDKMKREVTAAYRRVS